MATTSYNPFPNIGDQVTGALDEISTLSPASTVDDFVDTIINYIITTFYGGTVSTPIEQELKSVAYSVINNYLNNRIPKNFMRIENTPTNSLSQWFAELQDDYSSKNSNTLESWPMLMAIQAGKTVSQYWDGKVTTPGTWATFFDATQYKNYANINFWTEGAMIGAVLGAACSQTPGLIAPTSDAPTSNIVSAVIGAAAISGGNVVFKWTSKVISCDRGMTGKSLLVSELAGGPNGNGNGPIVLESWTRPDGTTYNITNAYVRTFFGMDVDWYQDEQNDGSNNVKLTGLLHTFWSI